MANKLILKNGAGIPAPEKLEVAELALDTQDGSLYSKLNDGSVVQLNDGADDVDLSDYVSKNERNDVIEGSFQLVWDDSADEKYPFNGRLGYNSNADDPNSMDGSFLYVHGNRGTFSIGRDGDVELHGPSEIQGIADGITGDKPWITGFSYVQADDFLDADGNSIIGSGGDGTGSSVHIGDTPPANPQEGQQWMEVPADGDATMWIYDGANWLQQPGGKDGADGADGTNGVDGLWTDNGNASISYMDGNVGIGTDTPLRKLHISEDTGAAFLQVTTKDDTSSGGVLMGSSSNPTVGQVFYNHATDSMYVVTSGEERMIIDADGNVGIGVQSPSGVIDVTSSFDNNNSARFFNSSESGYGLLAKGGGADKNKYIADFRDKDNTTRLRIDGDGRVDIAGSLYVNGTPKIGYSELITTLVTLRNATKDETTLEGLRDSIGNAVGGLIEEFENQIATMPVPEPQVGTQEISE